MKLHSKILLDDYYHHFWKQGAILPDPYPPDHPRAPCYRCNQLCQGVVNWLENAFRFLLVPSRRHRTRYFLLFGSLMFMVMLLNHGEHPMMVSHNIHSPTYRSSWQNGFLFSSLFGGITADHKSSRKSPLVQDWVFAPNCEALLRGDQEEIHFTKRMLYREVRDKVTDNEYYEHGKTCSEFRAIEGFPSAPLSHEEGHFPIAYVIQSYKNAEQVNRLLKSIYAPQNAYCICSNHKATPGFDKSVRSIADCFSNVFHVSTLKYNRTKNHVLSEMDDIRCARKCMKVLLTVDWKYLIKIHGQDYPLVPMSYIISKLKNLERLNIDFISDYSHMQRKQSVKILTNSTDNSTSKDITLWRGSPYFIASNSIIRDVLDNILTYKLFPVIQHYEHPEAYYWVTLLLYMMDDANNAAIVAANMHKIELLSHKKLHTKQYCGGITQLQDHCILGVEDISKLLNPHQHRFFAHGFDLDHDHVAYSCLEQRIMDSISELGGNLTAQFNDERQHAKQSEIVITWKEKPAEDAREIQESEEQARSMAEHGAITALEAVDKHKSQTLEENKDTEGQKKQHIEHGNKTPAIAIEEPKTRPNETAKHKVHSLGEGDHNAQPIDELKSNTTENKEHKAHSKEITGSHSESNNTKPNQEQKSTGTRPSNDTRHKDVATDGVKSSDVKPIDLKVSDVIPSGEIKEPALKKQEVDHARDIEVQRSGTVKKPFKQAKIVEITDSETNTILKKHSSKYISDDNFYEAAPVFKSGILDEKSVNNGSISSEKKTKSQQENKIEGTVSGAISDSLSLAEGENKDTDVQMDSNSPIVDDLQEVADEPIDPSLLVYEGVIEDAGPVTPPADINEEIDDIIQKTILSTKHKRHESGKLEIDMLARNDHKAEPSEYVENLDVNINPKFKAVGNDDIQNKFYISSEDQAYLDKKGADVPGSSS